MNQEMYTMAAEMEDMKEIKKTLLSWLKEEVSHGKECFDTKSCGDVSDIIKDMAEATKDCYKALYYKTVVEVMTEDEESVYGYNHRHMSNGKFTSSGKGHYVRGYNRGPYMDQESYIDAYIHDPNFKRNMTDSTMGFSQMDRDREAQISREDEVFNKYKNARRYYQQSKSAKDKAEMENHCMTYMENTIKNLRSMWKEADPTLKEKVKKDFGEEMVEVLEGI